MGSLKTLDIAQVAALGSASLGANSSAAIARRSQVSVPDNFDGGSNGPRRCNSTSRLQTPIKVLGDWKLPCRASLHGETFHEIILALSFFQNSA